MLVYNVCSWPQGQDELTRLSWNIWFPKERDGQIYEKLTKPQPITYIEHLDMSQWVSYVVS
jgi:hypothetical protein